MNVFTVGFPITLLFGLVLVYCALPHLLPNFLAYIDEGMGAMQGLFNL